MRSNRPEVRNPLLALPGVAAEFAALPADSRAALLLFLVALRTEAAARAEKCWRTHKAPMAVYWKCIAVYSRHLARIVARVA